MGKRTFLILMSCIGLCLIVWLSDARADDFDDIYVVQPPENEGGTFYLSLEPDAMTGRHPRAGYLPAMTLVKVIRENGRVKERMLCEERHGRECLYFEFVGSDGSCGYIKRSSTTPLMSLVRSKELVPVWNSQSKLVVPISATEEVVLFSERGEKSEAPQRIGSFSRSALDIILTDEDMEYCENEDHSERVPYYAVRFSQKNADGSVKIRDALIEAERENRTYRLFPVDPKSYKPVEVVTEHDLITRMKTFFSRFFSDYSTDEIARGLAKPCNAKLSISVKLKAGVGGNFKIADLSLAGEGTYLWEWKQGYRYTLETYRGFDANKESDVFKTIRCEEESSTDWYAHRFVVTNIGDHAEPFETFEQRIEGALTRYFEKPDTTGVAGTRREHMVVLKRTEDGSLKNIFEAYAALDGYLENAFFKDVEISAVEKLQFKSLIIKLVVDWSKS
jgi:hypothetical protein